MAEKSSFYIFFFFKASFQFVQHVWEKMEIEFMVVRDGGKMAASQNIPLKLLKNLFRWKIITYGIAIGAHHSNIFPGQRADMRAFFTVIDHAFIHHSAWRQNAGTKCRDPAIHWMYPARLWVKSDAGQKLTNAHTLNICGAMTAI